jgi:hypothetical protein
MRKVQAPIIHLFTGPPVYITVIIVIARQY